MNSQALLSWEPVITPQGCGHDVIDSACGINKTHLPRDSWGPLLLTEELLLSKEESDRETEKTGKDSSLSLARVPVGQAALSETLWNEHFLFLQQCQTIWGKFNKMFQLSEQSIFLEYICTKHMHSGIKDDMDSISYTVQ